MRSFQAVVRALSGAAAWLSAALLVYMVSHILLEIVLRNVFATSTFVLDEFVGYGVAAMTYLTLAYALREGSLIRVNLLLIRTRGPVRQGMEVFCVLATLALTVFLGWYFWIGLARDWQRGTTSYSIAEVPLWIPEGAVFVGLVLFGLQLFAYLVDLLAGRPPLADGNSE